jgi:hypothetical protein
MATLKSITAADILEATNDMKREVIEDVLDPQHDATLENITSYDDLDNYADANCYGGFCDDGTAGTVRNPRSSWPYEVVGMCQAIVCDWIREGGLERDAVKATEEATA